MELLLAPRSMDQQRKKALLEAYKNRRPDMGVIALRCEATGETFLEISKDISATMNGIRIKLNAGFHPNRRLLELWKAYGEANFTFSVARTLKYDDPSEDHRRELEKLREECLAADPKARKLWK